MHRNLRLPITAAVIALAMLMPGVAKAQGQPGQMAVVQSTSNVNVVNTPTVKDADAPGRKVFRTLLVKAMASSGAYSYTSVVTVGPTERLVVDYVSGFCSSITVGSVGLAAREPVSQKLAGFHYLSKAFISGDETATEVRFYVNPGEELSIFLNNYGANAGACFLFLSGYYISL